MSRSHPRNALIAAVLAAVASLVVAFAVVPAAQAGGGGQCHGGTLDSGTYDSLTITGACQVPQGATITVNGPVTVTGKGAALMALAPANIDIMGNVRATDGAVLGLGVPNEGKGCPTDAHAIVHGSVRALGALTIYLDCSTVYGHVGAQGGGAGGFGPSCEEKKSPKPLNFVIKDNHLYGGARVRGWTGCWLGYIRNVTYGSVRLIGNTPAEKDANEVVTNRIFGNLVCRANTPAPQVGDSQGATNVVFGHKRGQCRNL